MKKFIIITVGLIISSFCNAQVTTANPDKVLRIIVINPAIEVELPMLKSSTFTATLGVGSKGTFKNLAINSSEPYYKYFLIAPFLDLRYKNIYNLKNRKTNSRNTSFNSGNYWGARLLTRGPELYSALERIDNMDFSFGPIWGIQRSYGKFFLQIDCGPMYYFDTKGNSGFFALMIDLNIGFNLKKF